MKEHNMKSQMPTCLCKKVLEVIKEIIICSLTLVFAIAMGIVLITGMLSIILISFKLLRWMNL